MSRVARFAAVGMLGWLVQLAALTILLRQGLHYAPATAAAVELAILHNFAWHERYTWRDRRAASGLVIAIRLLRFNASTAVVSIVGNVFVHGACGAAPRASGTRRHNARLHGTVSCELCLREPLGVRPSRPAAFAATAVKNSRGPLWRRLP